VDLAGQLQSLGADVHPALEHLAVPIIVFDRLGIVRYGNTAAFTAFGDIRGLSLGSLVEPESLRAAQASFARKIVGTERATELEVYVRLADGSRALAEVSAVALEGDGEVVGVFGLIELEDVEPALPDGAADLTPRQLEVLSMLAQGCTTVQMAERLGISSETVRNHVRDLLHRLHVHSRLEAVVRGHELELV
jgi:PAS domain S-box-containing protein